MIEREKILESIRVAAAQIAVTHDIDGNVAAIERGIDYAAREGADILLTPEGSLSGYTHEFDAARAEAALTFVTQRARAENIGLALGTCFVEANHACYNQVRFYNAEGAFLGFHSKTLTCGSMSDPQQGEINHYAVAPLSTFDLGDLRVGALICNDLWANPQCTPMPDPHLTHQLAQRNARVIFHAVNGGRSGGEWSEVAWRYHESNLRMRAQASGVWIVTVDSCHPTDLRCSSPSGVVNPQGDWVCQTASMGEQFFSFLIEA